MRSIPEHVVDGTAGLIALYLVAAAGLLMRGAQAPAAPEGVLVEVRGDVARPGLFWVDPPTLSAAMELAGGPPVRQDDPLSDGDVLEVGPSGPRRVGTDADAAPATVTSGAGIVPAVAASEPSVPAAGPRPAAEGPTRRSAPPSAPIDINRATAAELDRLPSIGPSLAAAILAERAARGPFRTVDDLSRVKGIGPATLEKVRPYAEARP